MFRRYFLDIFMVVTPSFFATHYSTIALLLSVHYSLTTDITNTTTLLYVFFLVK